MNPVCCTLWHESSSGGDDIRASGKGSAAMVLHSLITHLQPLSHQIFPWPLLCSHLQLITGLQVKSTLCVCEPLELGFRTEYSVKSVPFMRQESKHKVFIFGEQIMHVKVSRELLSNQAIIFVFTWNKHSAVCPFSNVHQQLPTSYHLLHLVLP